MSKRKKKRAAVPQVLVGFDAAAGEDKTAILAVTPAADETHTWLYDAMRASLYGHPGYRFHRVGEAPKPLPDAVAEQVGALTADFDGTGRPELPTPARDLTAYADAFESAAKNCQHPDAIELLYGREWLCETCGRILDRDAMRRARASSSIFGGWFGL